jgi:hypothetical protein
MTQIFVPVHRNAHWCLAVINMKDKTLQYLESLVDWGRDVLDILVGLSDQTESYTILRLECLMGLAKGYQTIVKGYGDQQPHDDLFHQQQHEDLFSSSKAKQKVCIFISFGSSMKIYDRWAIESHQKLRHHII